MTDAGALWAEQSTDPVEAEALFEARRLAYPALERLGPVLTEDMCVPRAAVPSCWPGSRHRRRHGITIATSRTPVTATCTRCSSRRPTTTRPGEGPGGIRGDHRSCIELGGTVSGEHGIGLLKRDGMYRELDPGAIAMQDAVRGALDPLGIFNPGKG